MNEVIRARLEELRGLPNRWFRGGGVAPGNDFLDWMRDSFAGSYPVDFLPCEIISIVEGGLRVNWFGPAGALAADVYFLPDKYACLYGVTMFAPDRVLAVGEVGLDEGWHRVLTSVSRVCFRGGLSP